MAQLQLTAGNWYRYDGNFITEYKVLKYTPKGIWIECNTWDFFPARPYSEKLQKKFILLDARKQWASPTRDGAIEHWKARKRKQISILQNKIYQIEQSLYHAPKDAAHYDRIWNWQIDPIRIEL